MFLVRVDSNPFDVSFTLPLWNVFLHFLPQRVKPSSYRKSTKQSEGFHFALLVNTYFFLQL